MRQPFNRNMWIFRIALMIAALAGVFMTMNNLKVLQTPPSQSAPIEQRAPQENPAPKQ